MHADFSQTRHCVATLAKSYPTPHLQRGKLEDTETGNMDITEGSRHRLMQKYVRHLDG